MTFNVAFNTLIGTAKSEAFVALSLSCSTLQVSLINNGAFPVCTAGERKSATACQCCSTVNPNVTQCSTLASPTSQAGGTMSFLAKYDGGLKLSAGANSNFPLSDGTYTPILKRQTPSQILFGAPSVYVGTIKSGQLLALEGPTSTQLLENAATTADMKAVCYPLYCPVYQQVAQTFLDEGFSFAYLQTLSCEGLVPNTATLMSTLGKACCLVFDRHR